MAPIRTAFCITELDPGGAERALVELVKRLDRVCFKPAVFCLGPRGALAEDLEHSGVPVICLGAKRSRDVGVAFRLLKALRAFQPAILQTWLYHANILGRLAGRMANVPIVVSGIRVAERRSRIRLWADRLTQHLVDAHICVSEDVAKFSIEQGGLKPERVHIIPNGVDGMRFQHAETADLSGLGIPHQAKVVLFVGRLDPQKDPLLLLDAFAILQNRLDDVHLIFAGTGPLESELREAIERLHLEKNAHLLGWRGDVPELLKAADVLVLPSRWEGMPNVVLEAFAAGTPVVTTEVEGISQLVASGETGWILKSRDPDGMAETICRIFQNPDLAAKVARSAQVLAMEKFTWDEARRDYVNIYLELLRKIKGA